MGKQALNLQERRDYVRNIRDLEVSCYQLKRLIGDLQKKRAAIERNKPQTPEAPPTSVNPIINQIEGNTEMTAYYGQITASNMSCLSWLATIQSM